MTSPSTSNFWLFLRGVLYVGLQAINTVQLAEHRYLGAFVVGFLISLVWSFNVRQVAIRSGWAGAVYALGAAVGTVGGLYIAAHRHV